jgi:N-acetylglucosamine kinase-like BadF-type ATPase
MNEWVLGIDGGGTSSRIRVESMAGETFYQGSDGSTNLNSNDAAAVTTVLARLVSGAIAAGLDPEGCRAGFIGSAGVDLDEDRATMAEALANAFRSAAGSARKSTGPAFAAGNDAEPALVGALADVEGYLLIAGTGSIALARTESGDSARSGGWGHFLGDEGSAFWIAFEAIKRGIRAKEGRDEQTRLLESALAHFGLADAPALIPFTYWDFDKARIASFAPRVAEAAEAGDALAAGIMDAAAAELAALAVSVHDMMEPRIVRKRLALYGGLLEKNRRLRSDVAGRILAARPGITIIEPAGDAQTGACRLARELALYRGA